MDRSMKILLFIAHELSRLTNKNFLICKGILRFAIRDYSPTLSINSLEFYELEIIICDKLLSRLQSFNLVEAEKIIESLHQFILEHQSVLTLMY